MSSGRRQTILIVEDNHLIASTLKQHIEQHSELQVELEERGDAAVDRILREAPDLVVLDLSLPGLDGYEVCERVRADFGGPIMVLTGQLGEEAHLKGLGLGADDFVTKPISPKIVLARIQTLLRRTGPAAPQPAARPRQTAATPDEVLRVGRLEIHPRSRTAAFAGRPLDLQTGEFDVLWLLARNAGIPVGRDRLHQIVRGTPWDGKDRLVDVIVARLRSKLDTTPHRQRWIRTVRGVGYLLTTD